MRSGTMVTGAAAMLLSGCATSPAGISTEQLGNDLDANFSFEAIDRAAYRSYAASDSEMPFDFGAMSIVTAEEGAMRGYTLVPCGEAVCAGSADGPHGQVEMTPDYVIVSGVYGGTFWLSPGGDGALVRTGGDTVPLAWDSLTGPF